MIKRIGARLCGILTLLAGVGARVLAQGKASPKYDRYWLPEAGTAIAGRIDGMFDLILYITCAILVLVALTMAWLLLRYRARPGGRAIFSHGNNRLEIIWTVIPAVIVVTLGFMSRELWSSIKETLPSEKDAFVVEVRPRQFQWDISYAGADGAFGTPDDVTAINQLHVPAGRDILVKLTAQDVIHSFFVPEFRVKQDAVPGMETRTWFNAPRPGSYEIACAELCGLGHYMMRGFLTVHAPAEFDRWYAAEQGKVAARLAPRPAAAADSSDRNDGGVSRPVGDSSPDRKKPMER